MICNMWDLEFLVSFCRHEDNSFHPPPHPFSPGFSVNRKHSWLSVVAKSDVNLTSNIAVPDWKCLFWKPLFREISNEASSESSVTEQQYFSKTIQAANQLGSPYQWMKKTKLETFQLAFQKRHMRTTSLLNFWTV